MTLLALAVVASYLIGAVPFGHLVARARGVDILEAGSGNIGATNVGRVLGRAWGLLVFALDLAKGALPTLAASLAAPHAAPELPPGVAAVSAGVAAFLGHLFPVYLRFRGGKGVATGVGVVLALTPLLALAVLLFWATVLSATRTVSAASLAASAVLVGLRLTCTPQPWGRDELAVTLFCLVGAALVCIRHAANIRRLAAGTENRIKETATMQLLGRTLHVTAVGLWFGCAVFFTVMGLVMASAFEEASRKPRPTWFPVESRYDQQSPGPAFPDPLLKEQGARAFGAAVGPLFPWYFGIQGGCAVVALVTALGWYYSRSGKVHKVRAAVLLLAAASVGVGWWLERVVHDLRVQRDNATDDYLRWVDPKDPATTNNSSPLQQETEKLRNDFRTWHNYSLMVNMLTLALVTVAMLLAGALPTGAAAPTASAPAEKPAEETAPAPPVNAPS
jgi:acyl-phosphate glycerol 3-phosphate acyltransferase